ncbi:MAG TPA: PDZ domain-containing protein [Bacteroidota bacterium]|nr:PDZ domain-containing protein [Bacteroidota bacterium]
MKPIVRVFALAGLLSGILSFSAIAGDHGGNMNIFTMSSHHKDGWLGVSIQDISSRLRKEKGLKSDEGAYVSEVVDDSPADSAGIKEGDVIVKFNGKEIEDADDLMRVVQKTKPGTRTSVEVMRKDEKKSLDIVVGNSRKYMRNQSLAFAPPAVPRIAMFNSSRRWGLDLSELNEQLGEYFGAPNGRGILVERVEKKSEGAKAGFKAGDVITKVNKNSIEDMQDLSDALEDVDQGDKVDVEILRKGSSKTLTVEIGDEDDAPSSFNFEFNQSPDWETMHGFRFNSFPSQEMEKLRTIIRKSLPDRDALKDQIEELRTRMMSVTV